MYCIPIVSRKLVSKVRIGIAQIIAIVVSGIQSGTKVTQVAIAIVVPWVTVAKVISQVAITIVVPWAEVKSRGEITVVESGVSIINVISWICGTVVITRVGGA